MRDHYAKYAWKTDITFLGFDAIWSYVPSFSKRQLALTVITGIISFQDGLLNMYPIFAVYTPKTFNCGDDSRLNGFNDSLITYNGRLNYCRTIDNCLSQSIEHLSNKRQRCNAASIDFYQPNNNTDDCGRCNDFEKLMAASNLTFDTQCSSFEYEDAHLENTIVTQYNLVCNYQWLKETVFSLGGVGLAIGSFVGGSLTEHFGRKRVMFLVSAVCLLTLTLQVSFENLVVFNIFWLLSRVASQIKYLAYSRNAFCPKISNARQMQLFS